jgi:hypothetical protein
MWDSHQILWNLAYCEKESFLLHMNLGVGREFLPETEASYIRVPQIHVTLLN